MERKIGFGHFSLPYEKAADSILKMREGQQIKRWGACKEGHFRESTNKKLTMWKGVEYDALL